MIVVKKRSPWHRSQNPSCKRANHPAPKPIEQEMGSQQTKAKRSFVPTAVAPPPMASDAWGFASLITTTEQRIIEQMMDRSLALRLSTLLLLSSAMSFPLRGAAADPNLKIGRYETNTKECSFTGSKQESSACITLQLKGRSASVVAVRLIGHGSTKNSRRQLTFVTLTTQGESPLKCSAGTCRLDAQSWQSAVSSVAEASFNSNGIATGLPKAWAANNGECSLKDRVLRCSALHINGEIYKAEAHF